MKKILNSKMILIVMIVLVVSSLVSTFAYATDTNSLNVISDPNATANTNNNVSANNNIQANNTITNNTNTNNANTSSYNNTNNTTKLPQTGIEDYSLWLIIPVCVLSAAFAYKKIRDYNV